MMGRYDHTYEDYCHKMVNKVAHEDDKHLKDVFSLRIGTGCIDSQYEAIYFYQQFKKIKQYISETEDKYRDQENSQLIEREVETNGIYPGSKLVCKMYKHGGKLYVLGIAGNFEPFTDENPWPFLDATQIIQALQGLGEDVVLPTPDELKFWQRLEAVKFKADEHYSHAMLTTLSKEEKDSHMRAYDAAITMYETIRDKYRSFYSNKSEESLKKFKETCTYAIAEAKKSELKNHRGWKEIFANLVYVVPGVNVIVAAVRVVNVVLFKGNFWFRPNTDSIDKVEELEGNVRRVKLSSR